MKLRPIIPKWLTFDEAVQEIERRLGEGRRTARKKLREVCRTDEVASWKEPYSIVNSEYRSEGPPQRIVPAEWRTIEVDLATDADGSHYSVSVDTKEFREWLRQQPQAVQKPSPAQRKALGKRPRIKVLLAEQYPNGVPDPSYCNRQTLAEELCKIDPALKPLDQGTLKAAIDEYNGGLIRNDPT
jgi:hypothetical protein